MVVPLQEMMGEITIVMEMPEVAVTLVAAERVILTSVEVAVLTIVEAIKLVSRVRIPVMDM